MHTLYFWVDLNLMPQDEINIMKARHKEVNSDLNLSINRKHDGSQAFIKVAFKDDGTANDYISRVTGSDWLLSIEDTNQYMIKTVNAPKWTGVTEEEA